MDFISSPCTFLGYSVKHKGYKCLSSTGRTFISRHVIFDETCFPFQTKSISFSSQLSSTSNSSESISLPLITLTTPILSNNSSTNFPSVSVNKDLSLLTVDHLSSSSNTPLSPDSNCSQHSSPITTHSSPQLPNAYHNIHPMITRTKNGIHKPKILLSALNDQEPSNIHEALKLMTNGE